MSNGDNVLDNWEEIDEAGGNSLKEKPAAPCERITNNTQFGTDLATPAATTNPSRPTQMKLLQRSNTQDTTTTSSMPNQIIKSSLDDMSATFQPVLMVLHKPQDEYQSANYTAPIANQTVKILRRPTQSTEIRNNGIRPKQPIKTLQQREQEYAEARLRILGSAKNPEDEEQRTLTAATTSIVTSTSSTTITSSSTSVSPLSSNTATSTVTTSKIKSPKLQTVSNQYNNHFNQQIQQQQKYQQNYQQQQQNYFYSQQQQQQPQSPTYNNNRTYNMNPLLALGPMGPIGQPAQYQTTPLSPPQTQQHFKFQQQYHQKSPQQPHKSQQQQQTWSPVVGGSVSSSSIRQQPSDTILRAPRGPDGSTGFQMRR